MTFCTFYKNDKNYKNSKDNLYDHYFNGISALTKIRFRLKKL